MAATRLRSSCMLPACSSWCMSGWRLVTLGQDGEMGAGTEGRVMQVP